MLPHPVVFWFDSEEFDVHESTRPHPERPARLHATRERLRTSGLASRLQKRRPREVSNEWLRQVHDSEYLVRLRELDRAGGGYLDVDTYLVRGSERAALLAAGAVEEAVLEVLKGPRRRAVCTVRPPGHHATRATGMGFCLLNNVAVGAHVALSQPGVERVAIFDWDVHHGNGTEEIFYENADVFYGSVHQRPAYPGTGGQHDRGQGRGRGTTLNCPLAPGAGDVEMLTAWQQSIRPALEEFAPDLLLISAGFDANGRDPIAQLRVTTDGFRRLSEQVVSFAEQSCQGRLVSVLEGGYDETALADDLQAHIETLLFNT